MLDDFVEAKRGGICGIMCDRYINNGNSNSNNNSKSNSNDNSNRSIREPASQMSKHDRRSIWYIDANNIYGFAMKQKLPYKDFNHSDTSLEEIIANPDDSDHGYYIVCDINYSNSCKDRIEQIEVMPNKRKINDNEISYRQREEGRGRTEKLI